MLLYSPEHKGNLIFIYKHPLLLLYLIVSSFLCFTLFTFFFEAFVSTSSLFYTVKREITLCKYHLLIILL